MHIKPGLKLKSSTSKAQFIVIRCTGGDLELTCHGAALAAAAAMDSDEGEDGTDLQVGKRYSTESGEVELLCTRAGLGPLQLAGHVLSPTAAKALPSSD